MENEVTNQDVCPFIRNPLEKCYCANLDSLNTEEAIFYCIENFENCEIYRKYLREN
jgi:hypothetical protein